MTLLTRKTKQLQHFGHLEFRTAFHLNLNGSTNTLSSGLPCPAGKISKVLRLNSLITRELVIQMMKCTLNYVMHFLVLVQFIFIAWVSYVLYIENCIYM